MASSIGRFTFLQMTGPSPNVAKQLEMESRAGIDGTAVWDTGTRGEPFQVETLIDLASLAICQQTFEAYQALIGAGPHAVVWANIYTGISAEVISVQPISAELAITAVGGINGGTATLRARWTLLPLKLEE